MTTLYRPELLYRDGGFVAGSGLLVSDAGVIPPDAGEIFSPNADVGGVRVVELPGKVLLPGFVNAHSHSFQRLIRGRAESRAGSGRDFWSWRGTMYRAANALGPEDVYDAARMVFLEMALAGITTVGEFHYLHNAADGKPYENPNLLAKRVIAAARSVGLRIVLLRVLYVRSGFEVARDPAQVRFFETGEAFLENMNALMRDCSVDAEVGFGVAPHSVRAVPLPELKKIAEWNRDARLPLHMHVSEQVAENEACVREHEVTPVELLRREGILSPEFTAVHAIHVTDAEMAALADAGAAVCACPTTERNLGDGVFAADRAMAKRIRVALGTDSQAQIDPMEDARELEYHLRLVEEKRGILDGISSDAAGAKAPFNSEGLTARLKLCPDTNRFDISRRLLECATANGSRALGIDGGELKPGMAADFFTVDLKDVTIAGHSAEDLLPLLVFALRPSAVRDVAVNGKMIVCDGQHAMADEIVSRYAEVHRRVWRAGE